MESTPAITKPGKNSDSVDQFYKPSIKREEFSVIVECRPVDRSSTDKNQPDTYLHTGRRYGLTDARTAGILHPSKSRKAHKSYILKSNKKTGVQALGKSALAVRRAGGLLSTLEALFECLRSFLRAVLSQRVERWPIMDTLNPSCVCDTHSPLEALLQRSTDWEALEPVIPPPFGNPSPDDVLRLDAKRHNWPVYLVNVPDDWEPNCWRSVPPHTQTYRKAKTAAEVAAILNRERIANSKDGYVSHWLIRVRVGGRYANLSVSLNTPFKPRSEFDLPPAFITIDGGREQCKQIVGELNNRLDNPTNGEKRKRAYIARSICPGDLQ